jgi:hypothetical protein
VIVFIRLVIIAVTAILSATGLVLIVVALLAAKWLIVGGVVLFTIAVVGGALAMVRRLARPVAASGSED